MDVGATESIPIVDCLLSESIVGEWISDELDEFIAYNSPEKVAEIAKKLNSISIDDLISTFSP